MFTIFRFAEVLVLVDAIDSMSALKEVFTLRSLASWVFIENIHRYQNIPLLFTNVLAEEEVFLSSLSGEFTLVESENGGILENSFPKFTIEESGDRTFLSNNLGNFIHHYSEDNNKVFKIGPPNIFTSQVFAGTIKEETYINKELVYTEKNTLNILTDDCCYEGSINNLSIESTHHTSFRLCEVNTSMENKIYILYFERNLSWFQGETVTIETDIGKYIKK